MKSLRIVFCALVTLIAFPLDLLAWNIPSHMLSGVIAYQILQQENRAIIEKVNELAAAKVLVEDNSITGLITYEPDFLPDGRKIDFVIDRGKDNLYVEVKTVRPRSADSREAWQRVPSGRW